MAVIGGPVPTTARWPEVSTDAGDWAFHCHKSHHPINAMGHDVLERVKPGDRVKFQVERVGGALVVTELLLTL